MEQNIIEEDKIDKNSCKYMCKQNKRELIGCIYIAFQFTLIGIFLGYLIFDLTKMEPEDPQDNQPLFYSINKLVEEYPKSKNISVYIWRDFIKESVTKNKKYHYVKPLAIRVDNDDLDRDICWNFNLREKEYTNIQLFKKYDYFKIEIDSSTKQSKILPNGDKMIYYNVLLKKIEDQNLIEEIIGDLDNANN
jgi:hypothetical protein